MHGQRPGQLFELLANLVAVHGPSRALQEPQNHQRAGAGIQLFLEFSI